MVRLYLVSMGLLDNLGRVWILALGLLWSWNRLDQPTGRVRRVYRNCEGPESQLGAAVKTGTQGVYLEEH